MDQGRPHVPGPLAGSPEESVLCMVSESENNLQKTPRGITQFLFFFFLLGKNRPLTRTYPQEEAPLWHQGVDSAVPPADTRWC